MAGDQSPSRRSSLAPLRPPPRPGESPQLATQQTSSALRKADTLHLPVAAASNSKIPAPVASTSRLAPPRPPGVGLPKSRAEPGARARSTDWQEVGSEFRSDKGKVVARDDLSSLADLRPARPGQAAAPSTPSRAVKIERKTPPPPPPQAHTPRPLGALPQFAPPKSTSTSIPSNKRQLQPIPDPRKRARPSTPPFSSRPHAPPAPAAPDSHDRKPPTTALLKTPASARAAKLFESLNVSAKRIVAGMGEDEKPPVAGGKTLGQMRPRVPEGERWDEMGALDEWRANLSPRKKGPYVVNGLASQAADLFARTRTQNTLWQSDITKEIQKHQPRTLTARALNKLVRPTLRVEVLDILSPAHPTPASAGDATSSSPRSSSPRKWARRDNSKLVLARCRLLLGIPTASTQQSASDAEDQPEEELGLIAFSLQLHSSATSSTAAATFGAPPVLPQAREDSPKSAQAPQPVSLFLPTTANDLKVLRRGVEVWIWKPEQVVMGPTKTSEEKEKGAEEEQPMDLTPQNAEASKSGEAGEAEKETEGEGEDVKVGLALVCSRFAVLV